MGRGDRTDVAALLDYWGAPLTLVTDAGTVHLPEGEHVLAVLEQQMAALREQDYGGIEELDGETIVLNAHCALQRVRIYRLRRDGGRIGEFEATYLITDGPNGRRFSALVFHQA
ncbi:MAG: DUF6841 family protein [Sporichthyaceae bacterium]